MAHFYKKNTVIWHSLLVNKPFVQIYSNDTNNNKGEGLVVVAQLFLTPT